MMAFGITLQLLGQVSREPGKSTLTGSYPTVALASLLAGPFLVCLGGNNVNDYLLLEGSVSEDIEFAI